MIQLKVFPNTGHQYFEVDLKDLLPKKDEDWLERFVWSNRGSWRSWDDYTSWIRYQYAMTWKERPNSCIRFYGTVTMF